MLAGMEEAAGNCVQPFLDKGMTTVGVHVDITHKAATPAGLKVFFKATLLENSPNGKKLTFHIEARDERELIGEGAHERIIVDQKKFELKTALKKPKNV
ncbi:MAG: thioesterase family protein, partial [Desulfovibrio sp.]|nr:thioesterase family protein [Desulfovibrio sp.]